MSAYYRHLNKTNSSVMIIPVVWCGFVLIGRNGYLGRHKSWNGDTEVGETRWRLPGIFCWLVSILEKNEIDLIFGIND